MKTVALTHVTRNVHLSDQGCKGGILEDLALEWSGVVGFWGSITRGVD